MNAPQAIGNSALYSEMGILPLKYEIHIKLHLSFLHHIILPEHDPVRKTWKHQLSLPDCKKLGCGVKRLMFNLDEKQMKKLPKESYKH